tara:strand:- start:1443 stop:2234 length:792 start_codon:yes stop_codon:yes gene_type:complete
MNKVYDLLDLNNRTALITGAAGSLGQEIAYTIAELGGNVILVDKPGSNFTEIKNTIKNYWEVDVVCMDCDLEIEKDRTNLIDSIDKLDILINNAAFVGDSNLDGWTTELTSQTIDTWRRAFEVNLTAAFDLSKGLCSKLEQSQNGSIINIASIYGFSAPDYSLYKGTDMGNPAAYAASKGGLIQLTRWLASTLAPKVRVNSVSPGGILRDQPVSFISLYENKTPLKRMATEKDLKGIIAYLASDLSEYVTGQNLVIDGGWSIW